MTPAEQLAAAMAKPKRPAKFRNKVIEVEGEKYDSIAEYSRWCVLKLRERAGEITDLRRQVRFDLEVNGTIVAGYIADACYNENGEDVVEDTKSPATKADPTFRLKSKLMKACHGIDIKVVP